MRRSSALAFFLGTLLGLGIVAAPAGAQSRYRNLVNQPFATVSSGPQSALIVDVPRSASAEQVDNAVKQRLLAAWGRQRTALRRARPTPGSATIPVSSLVMVRRDGRLVTPARTRAVGNGVLTFTFKDFNGAQVLSGGNPLVIEDFLRAFLQAVYPRLVALYGPPAVSGNVEVVSLGFFEGGQATDRERFAFGGYDASRNRILLPLYVSVDSIAHAFLLNLIHAFHGPAVFAYDSWEQGFARAAAAVIARDPALGFLDPTANFLYTLLPRYDLMNQPPLGNSTFFPPSQAAVPIDQRFTVAKMLWARIGMAGAAWEKAYIEDPTFFRRFNAAYYAQFTPGVQPSAAGNIPALKAIGAALLPGGIEGLPFADWYARQYALDTSVSLGPKLYAFPFPFEPDTEGRQSASVALVYYRTRADGDEELLEGTAYATYFDAENVRTNFGVQSESAQLIEGEGAVTATKGQDQDLDSGRITAVFSAGEATARTYLPFGLSGDLQAVLLGPGAAGSVKVNQAVVAPVAATRDRTATIARAGFGVALGGTDDELYRLTIEVENQGTLTRFRRNVGEGRSYLALQRSGTGGDVVTVSRVFPTGAIPNLVSFPVRPLETSIDAALGLPASDFLLSTWDPLRVAYDTFAPGAPSVPALAPGQGVWLKLAPAVPAPTVNLRLTGVAPVTDIDFPLALRAGWNLIGSPFSVDIPLSQVLVKFKTDDAISWDDAVARNLVAAQLFSWDPAVGYVAAETLRADWSAYWVRIFAPTGVTLLLPAPDSPTRAVAAGRAAAARSAPRWQVRLRARLNERGRLPLDLPATVALGAADGATRAFDPRFDTELPPEIVPGIGLDFGAGGAGGRRVGDFRAPGEAQRGTWDLRLVNPVGGPVTLTWEGMGSLPRGTRLTLVDGATRVRLDRRSGYVVQTAPGRARTFQVISEPVRRSPLLVLGLLTVPTRASASMRIEYALSGDAEVEAEIATLSGRPVRRYAIGRARGAERSALHWDGRDSAGSPVPVGAYTLTLTARAEDGEVARVVRPVMLVR